MNIDTGENDIGDEMEGDGTDTGYIEATPENPVMLYDLDHNVWINEIGQVSYTDEYFDNWLGTDDEWELMLECVRENTIYEYGIIPTVDFARACVDFYNYNSKRE